MAKIIINERVNVFEAALQDLDKYFAPKVCIGVVRYKFFQRKQNKAELIDEWVDDLKKTCY